jgi:hypothetical protein
MVITSRITCDGNQIEIRKPEVILNYNKLMGGVDRADQMGSMYCFVRKSLKWWQKDFFLWNCNFFLIFFNVV